MLRGYLQSALFLLVVLSAPLVLWAMREQDRPGTKRHQSADLAAERARLSGENPDVLFIGNSMLYTRIARREFRKLSGRTNLFLSNAATASACWYLYLKNIVAPSGVRPEVIFVFFRDEMLTWPEYRTGSFYTDYFESLQADEEPVVERVLYASQRDRRGLPFHVANGVRSVYGIRGQPERMQKKLHDLALDLTSLGSDGKRSRRGYMNGRFSLENLRPDLGGDDAKLATRREAYDGPQRFDPSPDASFLPHMIDIADEAGFRLCFYRVKKREDVDGTRPPTPWLPGYLEELRAYVESRGALLFDETADPVPAAWYSDGDHIALEHRVEYTRMFWKKVGGAFPGGR